MSLCLVGSNRPGVWAQGRRRAQEMEVSSRGSCVCMLGGGLGVTWIRGARVNGIRGWPRKNRVIENGIVVEPPAVSASCALGGQFEQRIGQNKAVNCLAMLGNDTSSSDSEKLRTDQIT